MSTYLPFSPSKSSRPHAARSRTLARWLAIALLIIFFARMLDTASHNSPVVDEQSHISRGLSVWRTGDARLVMGHPLLMQLWEALPLAPDPTVRLPLEDVSWRKAAWDRFGELFLWQTNRDASPPAPGGATAADRIVFRSRIMVMLLSLVLGAVVFRWAADRGGPWAGVFALALLSTDPNIVAHGSLATTDLGVTLFMFAATWVLWRTARRGAPPTSGDDLQLERNTRRRLLMAGGLIGLACAAKFSALPMLPVWGILAAFVVSPTPGFRLDEASRRHLASVWLGLALGAFATVLVLYLGRLDVYVADLRHILHAAEAHPAFLLGERSLHGWWSYFPIAFLVKTPGALLLFMVLKVWMDGRQAVRGGSRRSEPNRSRRMPDAPFLLILPLAYAGISVLSGFNVGYRHLLPILPFLCVWVSGLVDWPKVLQPSRRPALRVLPILVGSLVAFQAWAGWQSHPFELTYFNVLTWRPHYEVLVDSNLDWGQGLRRLAEWWDHEGRPRIRLSYFGPGDPSAYGIVYDPLPRWPPPAQPASFRPSFPEPGTYVIGASNLQGILLPDPNTFDWFRHLYPDARVADSMLVYYVGRDVRPVTSAVLCREPWTPLEDASVGPELFGTAMQRVIRVTCGTTWVWPPAVTWAVVPPEAEADAIWAEGRVTYRHLAGRDAGGYVILKTPLTTRSVTKWQDRGFGASATGVMTWTLPSYEFYSSRLTDVQGVAFDGGLTLVGVKSTGKPVPGTDFEVASFWRVDRALDTVPSSIFGHLVDADGTVVAGSDGLGVEPGALQPGDVVAQRHRFQLPVGLAAGNYHVLLGHYRLDTQLRYHVTDGGGESEDEARVDGFVVKR